jgi:hypothetical protein
LALVGQQQTLCDRRGSQAAGELIPEGARERLARLTVVEGRTHDLVAMVLRYDTPVVLRCRGTATFTQEV